MSSGKPVPRSGQINPFEPPKRVVTGHTAAGQSTTNIVDQAGGDAFQIGDKTAHRRRQWVTKESPADNTDPSDDAAETPRLPERLALAHTNGTVLSFMDLPPGGTTPMHRTSSVDYIILIAGSLTLVLENGIEEVLSVPGSVVIQRGTIHAWENRSTEWLRMVAVLIDAKPLEVTLTDGTKRVLPEEFLTPIS